MKVGKYIPLGNYKSVKIGYGTVDFKNLKTIYLKLNSWVEPSNDDVDFDVLIRRAKRNIIERIYGLQNDKFKPQSIVDIGIKTNGVKMNKRSFMNLEITLYTNESFDIKAKAIKIELKTFIENLINVDLIDKKLFNFHNTKK